MTDMLEDIDEELLSFISDYKINLLEPMSIMDFTKFRTQLKQLFEVLQNASDKNRLQAVLQEDEQFKNMDRETVEALNLFAGMNIQTDGKEEVIDMCKAWEEQREEGIEQGIEQGRKTEVFDSVQCGDYSTARGAQKLNLYIDEFKKQMMAAGFSIPQ